MRTNKILLHIAIYFIISSLLLQDTTLANNPCLMPRSHVAECIEFMHRTQPPVLLDKGTRAKFFQETLDSAEKTPSDDTLFNRLKEFILTPELYPLLISSFEKHLPNGKGNGNRKANGTFRRKIAGLLEAQDGIIYNTELEELLILLISDPIPEIRLAGFKTIEKIIKRRHSLGPSLVKKLLTYLRSPRGKKDREENSARLLSLLISHGDIFYVITALGLDYANGINGSKRFVTRTIGWFLNSIDSKDEYKRHVAIEILGNIISNLDKGLISKPMEKRITEKLLRSLLDPVFENRRMAVFYIRKMAIKDMALEITQKIIERYTRELDVGMREEMLDALKTYLPLLAKKAKSKDRKAMRQMKKVKKFLTDIFNTPPADRAKESKYCLYDRGGL